MSWSLIPRPRWWAVLIAAAVSLTGWTQSTADEALPSSGGLVSEEARGTALGILVDRYRDISRVRQHVELSSFRFGETFLGGSASRETQENETVGRTQETTTTGLAITYPVSRSIALEFTGKGTVSSDESHVYSNRASRRELSGAIRYHILPTLTVSQFLAVVADRYSRKSGGTRQIIDNDGFADRFRVEGSAAPGEDGRVGFTYTGEYRRQDVTGERKREAEGYAEQRIGQIAEVRVDLRGGQEIDEYPIGLGEDERKETRERLQGGGELSCDIALPRDLGLSVRGRTLRTKTDFAGREVHPSGSGDRVTHLRGAEGRLRYAPGDRFAVDLSLGGEREVVDFREPGSADDEEEWSRTGGLAAEYRFGEGRSLGFSHRLSLDSHYFAHPTAEVPRSLDERDIVRAATEAVTTLRISEATTVGARLAHRSEELIYVRSERSANSRDHDLYELRSDVRFAPAGLFAVGQSYGLSADYTVYLFDDERNRLIRTLTVETNLALRLHECAQLGLAHMLEREDQGQYPRSSETGALRYQRSQELRRQRLAFSLDCRLGGVAFSPRYAYLETKRFDLAADPASRSVERRERDRRRERTYGVEARFVPLRGSDVRFSGSLIERDGEERYWDIDAAFNWMP